MKDINRRQFIKIGGSAALGTVILGATGSYAWKMFTNPGELFYGSNKKEGDGTDTSTGDFISPYKLTFGFDISEDIAAFDVYNEKIYIVAGNNVMIYNLDGKKDTAFPVKEDVRDIAIHNDFVYILYKSQIEKYSNKGVMVKNMQACSDDSDYCSFTVFSEGIFVTDASNKVIYKYDLEGSMSRIIQSPDGFVVPSYCFGITHIDDTIYCSNPGRHVVEAYTSDGEFISKFGKSGNDAGAFCGCCNPVHITPTNTGELLTSEKGIPRISCYGTDGTFRSVLLNEKMLGGGHTAYEMRIIKDKLIVAGNRKVKVFQYNSQFAEDSSCGQCTLDCPLNRK